MNLTEAHELVAYLKNEIATLGFKEVDGFKGQAHHFSCGEKFEYTTYINGFLKDEAQANHIEASVMYCSHSARAAISILLDNYRNYHDHDTIIWRDRPEIIQSRNLAHVRWRCAFYESGRYDK